jgi:hypothetical protein
VDRTRARSAIGLSLLVASLALAVFGLCFFLAAVFVGG